jgi:hypothetical protein
MPTHMVAVEAGLVVQATVILLLVEQDFKVTQ